MNTKRKLFIETKAKEILDENPALYSIITTLPIDVFKISNIFDIPCYSAGFNAKANTYLIINSTTRVRDGHKNYIEMNNSNTLTLHDRKITYDTILYLVAYYLLKQIDKEKVYDNMQCQVNRKKEDVFYLMRLLFIDNKLFINTFKKYHTDSLQDTINLLSTAYLLTTDTITEKIKDLKLCERLN